MSNFWVKMRQALTNRRSASYQAPVAIPQEVIVRIHESAGGFYSGNDVVFFEEMNAYAAFKYEVVKQILFSDKFGVSPMHVVLNKIYFQTNQERHAHNKRTAIKHLTFLSRKLQDEPNAYLSDVIQTLRGYHAKGRVINLVDELINPAIFINALNDFGFLAILPEFNPQATDFSYQQLIDRTKEIFRDRSELERTLEKVMTADNIPPLIKELLAEISTEDAYTLNELPLFYTTVIYTAIENTASFVSSLVYFVLAKFPHLLNNNDNEQLSELGNELLRIYSPNFVTFRTVLEDMQFNGVNLSKGSLVGLFIGAANTDPQIFPEPKEIRFDRTEKHLAFGRGHISCIGQFAAFRMALNIIRCLSTDADNITLMDAEPNFVTLGVVKLLHINVCYAGN